MFLRPLIVGLLGLFVAGCDRQSAQPEQANVATAAAPDEVTSGEVTGGEVTGGEVTGGEVTGGAATTPAAVGRIDRSHKGEAAPTLAFTAPDGKPATLADFRGKPVLLNLWATWCAPCVAEMPTLDAVASDLAGKTTVLAVSQDLQGAAKVTPFFAARRFATLKPYLDPKLGLSLAYQANLPFTILFDSTGREVWRMTGGNAWNTPAAKALIAEAR